MSSWDIWVLWEFIATISLDREPGGGAGHIADHLDHAHPQPEPQRPARHRDEVEGREGGVEGLRDRHLLRQGQVERGGVGSGTPRGNLASDYLNVQWNISTVPKYPNLNFIFRFMYLCWQAWCRTRGGKSSIKQIFIRWTIVIENSIL